MHLLAHRDFRSPMNQVKKIRSVDFGLMTMLLLLLLLLIMMIVIMMGCYSSLIGSDSPEHRHDPHQSYSADCHVDVAAAPAVELQLLHF